MDERPRLVRIVSGGRTGVDQAALDATLAGSPARRGCWD
jgi:predicted Rossmann fold nucleotide-binding protein DprA/Smf involved in DNA uptake